jgi:hypothetical protein
MLTKSTGKKCILRYTRIEHVQLIQPYVRQLSNGFSCGLQSYIFSVPLSRSIYDLNLETCPADATQVAETQSD